MSSSKIISWLVRLGCLLSADRNIIDLLEREHREILTGIVQTPLYPTRRAIFQFSVEHVVFAQACQLSRFSRKLPDFQAYITIVRFCQKTPDFRRKLGPKVFCRFPIRSLLVSSS